MFEVGEKIICIDENLIDILDGIMISGNGITTGKEYIVDDIMYWGHIRVINDCNSPTTCEPKLFANRTELRKLKIDKIKKGIK